MFLYSYECNECDFTFPLGGTAVMYATDDQGERHPCLHPGEDYTIFRYTGLSFTEAEAAGRIGSMQHCVCMECLAQFDLDADRDPLVCPGCSSNAVEFEKNLIDNQCPSCRKGKIEQTSPFRMKPDPDWESLPVPEIVKDMVEYLNRDREQPLETNNIPVSLKIASHIDQKYGSGEFSTIVYELCSWWQGNFLGSTPEEQDQKDSMELNMRWGWCKALPDVLDAVPALAELVTVRSVQTAPAFSKSLVVHSHRCLFQASVDPETRRGIKNYVRKYFDPGPVIS